MAEQHITLNEWLVPKKTPIHLMTSLSWPTYLFPNVVMLCMSYLRDEEDRNTIAVTTCHNCKI